MIETKAAGTFSFLLLRGGELIAEQQVEMSLENKAFIPRDPPHLQAGPWEIQRLRGGSCRSHPLRAACQSQQSRHRSLPVARSAEGSKGSGMNALLLCRSKTYPQENSSTHRENPQNPNRDSRMVLSFVAYFRLKSCAPGVHEIQRNMNNGS